MTQFSEAAWERSATLRKAIDELPFNMELAAGKLGRERFQGYIVQDALYLAQYARILAIAGVKGPDAETLRAYCSCALEAVAVEQALHERYLTEFGVDAGRLVDAEPSPDCLGYTSFLLATAYHEPWEVLVAALLPCFWIYWDVGSRIARHAAADNPYRAWIDTYADEGFGEAVRTVIGITDRAADATTAAIRTRMMTAFIRSTRCELLFWDGAYQQRGWPRPTTVLADHCGTLLGDHDGRRVGIAGGQCRHYRRIDHAQAADAVHAQAGVHDGAGPFAHAAGADRMKDRRSEAA
jgi:thiaminase/transcriptional activator TenA